MKIAFHTLGCKVNAYETERMIQTFKEAGHEIGDFDEVCDVYIVNTCTVTNIADRKSRQMLHRAKALNPNGVVAACGCFVETGREEAEKDPAIDLLIGNRDKKNIVSIVEDYVKHAERDMALKPEERPCHEEPFEPFPSGALGNPPEKQKILSSLHDHTRAYIKIQDGCDQFCSYCIIPYARGRIKSRESADVLKELEALAKSGVKEVVLTGIHLSSYGIDLEPGGRASYNARAAEGDYVNNALIALLRDAALVEGIERIRLGSLEPRIITDEFLQAVKDIRKACPHFHISLQSGSDSVLKRMNRHYDTKEYFDKLEMIRRYFEHPAITTDIIAGFPGESDKEFSETREFLQRADFYETHIFKYSRRKGTVADRLAGQLTEKEKGRRAHILSADDAERRRKFREYYIGRTDEVLFEEKKLISGMEYYVGFNREYVRFACESEIDLTNKIVSGKAAGGMDQPLSNTNEQLLVFSI